MNWWNCTSESEIIKEMISLLAHKHNVVIRTEEIVPKTASVQKEKPHTLERGWGIDGYTCVRYRDDLFVSQDTIDKKQLIKLFDPVGVTLRRAQRRRHYRNKGTNALWHMDLYNKLKPYGIAINGCIDGLSCYVVWMEAYRTNNDPKVLMIILIVSCETTCPLSSTSIILTCRLTGCSLLELQVCGVSSVKWRCLRYQWEHKRLVRQEEGRCCFRCSRTVPANSTQTHRLTRQ